ncbi:glycosyltransferase [Candidatus Woesearchaeota archaeon]|nr:glycosyltransferase [Candidatus Woesearchaeota archaeon]
MKEQVAFIYKNTCHPVTQTYANAINAMPYKITGPMNAIWQGITTQTHKWYFVESVMSMLLPITKRLLGNKITIIFRGNDGLFGETETTAYLATKNPIKKHILLFLIKHMNGVSVEAEPQKAEVTRWTKAPVEVCESYVENKRMLEKIKPNLKTNTFLFIGAYRPPYDHKGIRRLITLFNNKEMQEYNLIIIGKETEKLKAKASQNIQILDFVEDKDEYYKKATYYIHLPKYEAGPITLLEAMTAGLIIITNTNAGHHSIIEKVNKKLVLGKDASQEERIERIKEIVSIPIKEKQKIAETFKKCGASHYNKAEMTEKFQKTWKLLIKRIDEKEQK